MARLAKIVGGVCVALAALAAILLLVGYALPADYAYATERRIEAPAAAIFEFLDTQDGLIRWWTPALDAPEAQAYGEITMFAPPGPARGQGAQLQFKGGDDLLENWTILASEPPARVVYDIDFQIFRSERTLELIAVDADTTDVRWTETAHSDSPFVRWLATLEGDAVVVNFDAALEVLAQVAEGRG